MSRVAGVKPARLKWLLPVVVVELALLYLTRSRIGTILGLLALSALMWRLARDRMRAQSRALIALAALAVAVPAVLYAVGNSGAGAAQAAFMMGRTDSENTASLSNRAPLWAELMESVQTRPILGFGYAGFWTPARVERVSLDQGWPVPNAHETYLDQWLSVGLVGAILYIAMLWGACAVAWGGVRRSQSAENLFPALLLTWIALTSLAESAPLDPYLPTMLAYACLAKMAMSPESYDGVRMVEEGA